PEDIRCVLVRPQLRLVTRTERAVLPRSISLELHVEPAGNLPGFIHGCFTNDLELIRRSFHDLIAEPHRERLIPGFPEARKAALEAGALGCSISGAGPSVFAWCARAPAAATAGVALASALPTAGRPPAAGGPPGH